MSFSKLQRSATPQVASAVAGPRRLCKTSLAASISDGIWRNIAASKIRLSAAEVARLDRAAAAVKPILSPEANPFAKKDIKTGMIICWPATAVLPMAGAHMSIDSIDHLVRKQKTKEARVRLYRHR